ncbi:MAG: hypothetical protein ACD_75C02558G0002 [uncultured bacterium]|nr:MAG: hypothetical protein ACD_75C02558G0002 [uncultured bacterium]
MGDKGHAEDGRSRAFRLVFAPDQFHPAALAPAAGMDLGLDHRRIAEPSGDRHRFLDTASRRTVRHRHRILAEEFFCLIFVDFHVGPYPYSVQLPFL